MPTIKILVVLTTKTRGVGLLCDFFTGVRPTTNYFVIFTDLALGHRVAMSVCMYVSMSFIKVVIVNNAQSIMFFVFLNKIECFCLVLRILNIEGHQYCMIGLKITTILTTCSSMIN